MKSDIYTKTLLTIIAICLTLNIIKEFEIIPSAFASENTNSLDTVTEYRLVPLNEFNTIDVRIVDINTYDELNVNIKSIDTYDEVRVNIKNIDTYDELKVNITSIDTNDELKVNITSIDTNDELDVNIDEIGGKWVTNGGPINVKIE